MPKGRVRFYQMVKTHSLNLSLFDCVASLSYHTFPPTAILNLNWIAGFFLLKVHFQNYKQFFWVSRKVRKPLGELLIWKSNTRLKESISIGQPILGPSDGTKRSRSDLKNSFLSGIFPICWHFLLTPCKTAFSGFPEKAPKKAKEARRLGFKPQK